MEGELDEVSGHSNLGPTHQNGETVGDENAELRAQLEKQEEANRKQTAHLERSRAELNKLRVAMRAGPGRH